MKKILPFILVACSLQLNALDKKEAADFLLSTLSLPDRTDYPEQFYLDNIDVSFKAREEMPWGKIVPDREFLHFVLPVRVNNENLDNSREVFFEELKDRVKGLSMEDAILEVNHWCHEKVTYQPSDARTSSPLSSLSQAIGRCGEESTFTVAALRSVGIPARQIYTPRWAHTDDNHAWVEAWANGKWYFLGACEPEPVLNLGWFNAPASRGLLMSTNVSGDYNGEEEILLVQPRLTRINVTENYAPVAQLPVLIVDKNGNPVGDATVNFCIYNYSEFYPAVTKKSDSNGRTFLNSGLGDMLVWATDGNNFGMSKGRAGEYSIDKPLTVVLDKNGDFIGEIELDIVPPKSSNKPVVVSESQREENDRRKAHEDSIRNSYTSTFISEDEARSLADKWSTDEKKTVKILTESRGNHNNLVKLINDSKPEERVVIIDLLAAVSEKDRRDIPVETVLDHVNNRVSVSDAAIGEKISDKKNVYDSYVLNPRIENEFIRNWRSVIKDGFGADSLELLKKNPRLIKEWIGRNIQIVSDENPQGLRMSPVAVWNHRATDALGRDMFYVAVARTAGLPARKDPVTGNVQLMNDNGEWINVDFDDSASEQKATKKGWVSLTFEPKGYITDPVYYSQFTISKISDGKPQLLEFDENTPFSVMFAEPQQLEGGQYVLTSGQRLADGTVLSRSVFFNVIPGDTVNVPLVVRKDDSKISVIGSLNAENIYHDTATDTDQSLLAAAGRGYYVVGLLQPNHEPSEHALNDISAAGKGLEKDGRKIILLFDSQQKADRFDASRFPNLPENVIFGVDNDNVSAKEIASSLHLDNPDYPIFVVADSFNRIVWVSTGYTIGLGEQLLSILSQLE
ncbi:MAG: transglutaminase domain-containing protein [Muribaculaceae bacterium]|nr:transglutaminase domain-containing protein [Muribaculaceae bacterium]